MTETSYMARFGARLVTNGFGILPIGPGTKKPGQFKRGAWADYPEWNRHTERATTEVEVTTWSAWPECGIGLVGGAVAAVDIDVVEDAELALLIEQLARNKLDLKSSLPRFLCSQKLQPILLRSWFRWCLEGGKGISSSIKVINR